MNGGRAGPRSEYTADNTSVVGYIPDDVSSIHSSSVTGGVNLPANYPPMFSGFDQAWPTLPGARGGGAAGRAGKANGVSGAGSVAGESVAASELTESVVGDGLGKAPGQGGVSLAGLSLNDINKPASLSQSDRLKRYVEGNGQPVGHGRMAPGLRSATADDDDARSVSTAFASQVGGAGTYD